MIGFSVLMENRARDGRFQAEHGLSLLIRADGRNILLDTGQSGAFLHNAAALGIHPGDITDIILSHGHYDHTGGLAALFETAAWPDKKRPGLICHPDVLSRRSLVREGEPVSLGISEASRVAAVSWPARFTREPLWLTERVCFLGEIPRLRPDLCSLVGEKVPSVWPDDEILHSGQREADPIFDDSAVVVLTSRGLAVFTGCSHSGIVNIIEYARVVSGIKNVQGVYGGFHFKTMPDRAVAESVAYLEGLTPQHLFACHCSGDVLCEHPLQRHLAAGDSMDFASCS